MDLFFSEILTVAVYAHSDHLRKIAQLLRKVHGDGGEHVEREFTEAYQNYDHHSMNALISETLKKALRHGDIAKGLEMYLEKFGVKEELSTKSDVRMLEIVAAYRERILEILRRNGVE